MRTLLSLALPLAIITAAVSTASADPVETTTPAPSTTALPTPTLTTTPAPSPTAAESPSPTGAMAPSNAMSPTPTDAESPSTGGVFIGANVGAFWLQSLTAGSGLSIDFKYKTGVGFDIPFGYRFDNGLSLSVSAGYWDANYSSVTGNYGGGSQTAETNGGISFIPVMFNVDYKLQLGGGFSWYLGGGVGGVHEDSSFSAYDPIPQYHSISFGQLGGQIASFDGLTASDWRFGFQLRTGLAYDFNSNCSMNLGYQFMHVNGNLTVNGSSSSDFNTHAVVLGLTVKF